MVHRAHFGIGLLVPLMLAGSVAADEEFELLWSATLLGEFNVIASEEANNDVTGFFDQYEFIPNKSDAAPFQLGVRDASLDWIGGDGAPRLQFRLQSPSSNLAITGSQTGEPFLNQRALLLGRFGGIRFDVSYDRFRTQALRFFPNIAGTPFTHVDVTDPSDRFFRDRTGFDSEIRLRPHELFESPKRGVDWLAPELALRGGYQIREGKRQVGFLLKTANVNDPVSFTGHPDQDVGEVGVGLLLAPGGLFTMTFDFDHKRFRESAPATFESTLGTASASDSLPISFIPDSDRSTSSMRLHSRIGERAVLEAGFQVSWLEQVGDLTPVQQAAGLRENELLFYSTNMAADVVLGGGVSANAFFKYDQRDNDIQRDTAGFGRTNWSQVDFFFERWRRIVGGAEVVYQLRGTNQLALGGRLEWVDRELDFAVPNSQGGWVRPLNALVANETQMYTVYGRASLRPATGLRVRGEIGYREAPKTGYVVDLDDYVYGKLRASYALQFWRPVMLSGFGQGGFGKNRDFSMQGGTAAQPIGNPVGLDFERYDFRWGLTITTPLRDDMTLFASLFHALDVQDYNLVRSDVARYLQEIVPNSFWVAGPVEYRTDDVSLILGTHVQLAERTDAGLSYSFTHVEASYRSSAPSAAIRRIQGSSIVDADIHGLDLEFGHRLRDGLRMLVGYRFQLYDDSAPVPTGTGSVVTPLDPSTYQHTLTLGVTLTSDLLAR